MTDMTPDEPRGGAAGDPADVGEGPDAGPADNGPPPGRRRDPAFRLGLIERLPTLAYSNWSARDDFWVDQNWADVLSLYSDAVLVPLEPFAPGRRSRA